MESRIIIEYNMRLLSDTVFGSGYSIPGGADISVCKDDEGYPYLKGSTMKGLLRESTRNLADWMGLDDNVITAMFGAEGRDGTIDEHRINLTAASLVDRPVLPEQCYCERAFTQLENGVVKEGSLRLIECIKAGFVFRGTIECCACDKQLIEDALKGIKWMGTLRNRGFGHVDISCNERKSDVHNVELKGNTIYYRILLDSPVIMTDKARSFENTYSTDRYIKGAAVRGMVLGRIAQAVPEWFEHNKKELLSGKTRFFNALAYMGGVTLPPIKGFYEMKDGSGFQTVLRDGNITPGAKRASLGDACTIKNNVAECYNVRIEQAARIKRALGNADEEKVMFQNQYIEAGQEFEGYIGTQSPGAAQKIADALNGTLWLGADRYEGYGKCHVTVLKDCDYPLWIDSYGYGEDDETQEELYMLAMSPFTMLDDMGEPVGIDTVQLKKLLGLDEAAGLEIELCSTSVSDYGGYNRTWKCQLPLMRMYDMGSIFKIRITGGKVDARRIRELEKEGIGVRRAEGYGNILFMRNELFEAVKGRTGYIADEHSDREKADVDNSYYRRSRYEYIMKMAYEVLGDGTVKKPSKSQLGDIQGRLEKLENEIRNNRINSEGFMEELEKYFGGRRSRRNSFDGKFDEVFKLCNNVMNGDMDAKLGFKTVTERVELLSEIFDYSRKYRGVK